MIKKIVAMVGLLALIAPLPAPAQSGGDIAKREFITVRVDKLQGSLYHYKVKFAGSCGSHQIMLTQRGEHAVEACRTDQGPGSLVIDFGMIRNNVYEWIEMCTLDVAKNHEHFTSRNYPMCDNPTRGTTPGRYNIKVM